MTNGWQYVSSVPPVTRPTQGWFTQAAPDHHGLSFREDFKLALTDAMNERLGVLLENLSTVRGKLNDRSREFVDDQIKRHDQYGQDMRLSEKQLAWLENLHDQHCKNVPLPDGEERPDNDDRDQGGAATSSEPAPRFTGRPQRRSGFSDDRDPRGDADMDDDIPF